MLISRSRLPQWMMRENRNTIGAPSLLIFKSVPCVAA